MEFNYRIVLATMITLFACFTSTTVSTTFGTLAKRSTIGKPRTVQLKNHQRLFFDEDDQTVLKCFCNLPSCAGRGFECKSLKGCFVEEPDPVSYIMYVHDHIPFNGTLASGCMEELIFDVNCRDVMQLIADHEMPPTLALPSPFDKNSFRVLKAYRCCIVGDKCNKFETGARRIPTNGTDQPAPRLAEPEKYPNEEDTMHDNDKSPETNWSSHVIRLVLIFLLLISLLAFAIFGVVYKTVLTQKYRQFHNWFSSRGQTHRYYGRETDDRRAIHTTEV